MFLIGRKKLYKKKRQFDIRHCSTSEIGTGTGKRNSLSNVPDQLVDLPIINDMIQPVTFRVSSYGIASIDGDDKVTPNN